MPKILGCADITPMDQCGFAVQADTIEEVVEHGMAHYKSRHGTIERDVTPEHRSLARSRVRDVPASRPPAFTPVPRANTQLLYCDEVNPEQCLFVVRTDDVDEILEHLRMHQDYRHSMTDEGMLRELLTIARERIRPQAS